MVVAIYVFDLSKMEEKVKYHFQNFINERPELLDIKRVEEIIDYILSYGHDSDVMIELQEYIKLWNKDKNRVYVYLEEKDKKGFYFSSRLISELKNFSSGNSAKYLKKCLNNGENKFYKGGNSFSLFSLFYKFCIEEKKL